MKAVKKLSNSNSSTHMWDYNSSQHHLHQQNNNHNQRNNFRLNLSSTSRSGSKSSGKGSRSNCTGGTSTAVEGRRNYAGGSETESSKCHYASTFPAQARSHNMDMLPPHLTNRIVYGMPVFLSLVLYLNTLQAGFVYDDHRAVLGNQDVMESTPLWSVWNNDFWGSPISRKGSHGSWRPITTLSFRLNALVARALASDTKQGGREEQPDRVTAPSLPLAQTPGVPSYAVPSITPSLNPNFSATSFHALNILLHASVTAAYIQVMQGVDIEEWVCLGAGLLFAAHPVHVEAVAGIVGRAELLAALAFCLALAAYTRYIHGRIIGRTWGQQCLCNNECTCCRDGQNGQTFPCILIMENKVPRVYNLPPWVWLTLTIAGATVSMACKEQGVTALGVGLLLHAGAVISTTPKNKAVMMDLVWELWPISFGIVVLLWARLNIAPQTPSFTQSDNPAAHSTLILTRVLSIARGWAVHGRLLLLPVTLSFDWSEDAVPLITCLSDPANLETIILLVYVCVLAATAITACWNARLTLDITVKPYTYHSNQVYHDELNNNVTHKENAYNDCSECCYPRQEANPLPLVLAWGLLVLPFIPASNLVTYVGFIVAERVLYLPSMGASLLVALGCQCLWRKMYYNGCLTSGENTTNRTDTNGKVRRRLRSLLIVWWVVILVLFSARTLRRNKDWQSDETLYRSGIPFSPAKALSNLGVVYSEQGRLQEAEDAYRSALLHTPSMADTHFNLGLLLASSGRTEEAIESYYCALKNRPWLAQAHLGLAGVLQAVGREAEANKVLESCTKTGSAPARDGLGHAWAVTTCRQRLARAKLLAGHPRSALQEVKHALQHAPHGYGSHSLHTLAAEAHLEVGEHADAQEALSRALAAQPHHVPAHLTFSRMLQANGSRADEVEQWLRRAVALAPNDPHAHKHLGQLLLEQDRIEEAVTAWLRAALLDSTDHTAAFNAATALRLAGRNQHAETFYRRAVLLQPKDVASHRNLGAILHLNGKLKEAKNHYDEALTLSPGDPQTITNLQRLSSLLQKKGLS